MVARGYRGDARTLDRWRVGLAELVWIAGSTVAAGALLGLDRALPR